MNKKKIHSYIVKYVYYMLIKYIMGIYFQYSKGVYNGVYNFNYLLAIQQ